MPTKIQKWINVFVFLYQNLIMFSFLKKKKKKHTMCAYIGLDQPISATDNLKAAHQYIFVFKQRF